MSYTVLIDDNFYYMDDGYRDELGVFETKEEAIKAAKTIVDDFLNDNYKPGMTPEELYRFYTAFGEDPFVSGEEHKVLFSAWSYAKERCIAICSGG